MMDSGHPRLQFQRANWHRLDGAWQFAYDDEAHWQRPSDVTFDRTIQVPYPPG